MLPITNSVLSFVLLTIAIVTATHILILLGRNNKSHERYFKWSHRIWGYIFFALYIFICISMFQKLDEFALSQSKDAIHAYIGIIIFPLIIVKICIARFYKIFYKRLPVYGTAILVAVYLQVPLYAGMYIYSAVKSRNVSLSNKGQLVCVNINSGRNVVQQKCSTCHPLERVYAYVKTDAE